MAAARSEHRRHYTGGAAGLSPPQYCSCFWCCSPRQHPLPPALLSPRQQAQVTPSLHYPHLDLASSASPLPTASRSLLPSSHCSPGGATPSDEVRRVCAQ
ncbi:hypothetical protein PVAP13_3KG419627 [Panicum virgatum]|uniref:Uncharacterized protein n=1 Tax=Panicum virgatum TaxID=38727 RepID=A0A8T0V5U0_PANVG|nr:hypothetical protein PVAP13_3KG419627 [Panicum virgatum]